MRERLEILMHIGGTDDDALGIAELTETLDQRQAALGCRLVGKDENPVVLTKADGLCKVAFKLLGYDDFLFSHALSLMALVYHF